MKISSRKMKFSPNEDKKKQIALAMEGQIKGIWLYKFLTRLLASMGAAFAACGAIVCWSINNSLAEGVEPIRTSIIIVICATILLCFTLLAIACHLTGFMKIERIITKKNAELSVYEKTLKYSYKENVKGHRPTVTVEIPLHPGMRASYNAKLRKMTFFGIFKERYESTNGNKTSHGSRKGLVVYDYYEPSAHLILSQMGVPFRDE